MLSIQRMAPSWFSSYLHLPIQLVTWFLQIQFDPLS